MEKVIQRKSICFVGQNCSSCEHVGRSTVTKLRHEGGNIEVDVSAIDLSEVVNDIS